MRTSMRVVIVNYGGDFAAGDPQAALDGLRGLTGWAEAVRSAGAEVVVVQGAQEDHHLQRQGVEYHFVAGRFTPRLSRRRIPWRLHRVVPRLRPSVVHLNGLLYAHQARLLRRQLPNDCPLVLQHHGEMPDRGLARWLQRWGLAAAEGFFFTGHDTAEAWRRAGLITPHQTVFEIMEGSSLFEPTDRDAARAMTGLGGRPVYFWAGNLDPNKDPLAVLAGFENALEELPEARLYMAYRFHPLLAEVRQRIARSPCLERAVTLLGSVSYEQMEAYFNSADFFLQGSHKEGSGFALADALACGTVPLVTDIPAFRFMTAADSESDSESQPKCGALWPTGDAEALSAAILRLAHQPLEPQRQSARQLFERRLSFEVIGRQAVEAYSQLFGKSSNSISRVR